MQSLLGQLATGAQDGAVRTTASASASHELVASHRLLRLEVSPGTEAAALARLRARPDVLYAEEEVFFGLTDVPAAPPELSAAVTPDDHHYTSQWAPALIGLTNAWNLTTGSTSVTIGIVDTGLDEGHPEFKDSAGNSRIVAAVNCAGIPTCTAYSSGQTTYSGDHGTHVAGIAAATGNNKNGATNAGGVAGAAWGVKIASANVFTGGSATSGDVAKAIDWMLTQPGIKVINLSLGGPSSSTALHEAIDRAYAAGVLVVASAGNCGSATTYAANGCSTQNEVLHPAAYALQTTPQKLLPVAATTSADAHAAFSNQNTYVQLRGVSAPGDSIISTIPRTNPGGTDPLDGYGTKSGTSMAAPHVAGLAALMYSVNTNLTPDGAIARLKAAVVDRGASGADLFFGHGRVNALAAIELAQTRAFTGTLSLRRAAATPSAGHVTDFTLHVYANGTVDDGHGARSALQQLTGRTDSLGQFVVSIPAALAAGTYDVLVKPSGAIGRERNGLVVGAAQDRALTFSQFDEGDVDGSGGVTVADLNVVKNRFATTCASGATISVCPDLNRDGKVTLLDFSLLSRSYGRTGPTDET